jgi:glycerol kinase
VIGSMNADSGVPLKSVKVDGGWIVDALLMQFQEDILEVPVIRPVVNETTALGAVYAAGLAVGFWENEDDTHSNWAQDKRRDPAMTESRRESEYKNWKTAVTKTFDWAGTDD